jgi:hypothetical protein
MKVVCAVDDLPCDTVLHNLELDVRPMELLQITLGGVDGPFVVLRALRRSELSHSALRVPQWMGSMLSTAAECVATVLTAGSSRGSKGAFAVQLECADNAATPFDAAVLHRAVSRQLARQHSIKPGLMFATPMAGQYVTMRVVKAEAAGTSEHSVTFVQPPRVLNALQTALLSCYRPCLQPRLAHLLSASEQTHRRLLLVAHAALMPIELCTLLVEELGRSCSALTAEDVVVARPAAASTHDAVILSGLEELTLADSFLVLRWLESCPIALVILVVHRCVGIVHMIWCDYLNMLRSAPSLQSR